ncbi:vacuolar protein sorting-associated protein 32 homolog 2-like [Dioscorea cayenensis subsp. rotundata]|uniref:Vacuolar protein sorting-associated protein 32 homolog 2-like n=1 Tax=Dioscorea cayennensis subsp. rotundata TaxID=55577 RepID=A0AB40BX59_DIOCR|nr:vacuolar protein sorting-associated protein 32 homolog 2-like [Dioscorea cayenensis subsp. rotundata]
MLKKVFSMSKKKTTSSAKAISSSDKLQETLETLEKKEQLLQKKISNEIQKAKNYTSQKNKNAAIQCLKKKKLYEAEIERIANLQLRVHDQMLTLHGATATTETIDALRKGSNAVKSIQQSLNADDVSKTIEEASEQSENMKQLQDALATSIGVTDDFDEDELEAELEELEEAELEEQILEQNSTVTTQPPSITTTNLPKKETPKPVNNADNLADLQPEMAL